MIIDGKQLSDVLLDSLAEEVKTVRKKFNIPAPRLVIITVKPSPETESFMKMKQQACEKIGALYESKTYRTPPRFEAFVQKIANMAHRPDTHGIIIQEPLPSSLSTQSLFNFIPSNKEVEGFKEKSTSNHPISMAVLAALHKGLCPEMSDIDLVKEDFDMKTIKNLLKGKKIILIGRGKTAGKLIAATFSKYRIPFLHMNSTTPTPEDFVKKSDVIISAVGKKVLTGDTLKQGCILISVGMHKINEKWQGDYDMKDVENIAKAYTPTPGGVGPLNVAFLMFNLVNAWKSQIGVEGPMNHFV